MGPSQSPRGEPRLTGLSSWLQLGILWCCTKLPYLLGLRSSPVFRRTLVTVLLFLDHPQQDSWLPWYLEIAFPCLKELMKENMKGETCLDFYNAILATLQVKVSPLLAGLFGVLAGNSIWEFTGISLLDQISPLSPPFLAMPRRYESQKVKLSSECLFLVGSKHTLCFCSWSLSLKTNPDLLCLWLLVAGFQFWLITKQHQYGSEN